MTGRNANLKSDETGPRNREHYKEEMKYRDRRLAFEITFPDEWRKPGIPRRVRHDLGEYYTPDWIAEPWK
jgi:hypothetical protein